MQNRYEPIAIVGMGCRFPGGASNPYEFWKNLCKGKDAIIDVPKDRWDSRKYYHPNANIPGKMYVNQGGFLQEKWEDFDAAFFHISPREAHFLDPQQRLLLELTWEALEDGGVVPENIRNTETGVFIGAFTTDWQSLHNKPFNVSHCGMYSGINGSMTILSARLAYFFDLKGPCLTIDTACSSSLVALHLACQSIWDKTSSLAIAGGVNAMLIPETTIAMSKGRFLNPEGRCRPFDAKAMGYIRGEGGGVVILKPLAAALRDQDPIYALIRGTGVNHDGATQGIAQPNSEAQVRLIRKVTQESGVDPGEIHYIEAHGTGTPVGDPIEALALNEVLQAPSRKNPCYLGAVKSNIGHLEAAAGIAGVIKAALCLKHREIPPNLHFNVPNPKIPFEKYCLKVPTKMESFPDTGKPLFAGVNAFGYGGTNAHAVLESYEGPIIQSTSTLNNPLLFPFSAVDAEGLKEVAKVHGTFLKEDTNLINLAHTLSRRRSFLPHRLAVSAASVSELKHKLDQFIEGESPEGAAKGKILESKPRLAFVYTGMGPQWWGMGRELLEKSPEFLKTVQKCEPILGWSIIEELQKGEENSRMEDPVVAQVCNYVLQAGLTDVLRSWGVVPDAIAGHSIGEVAAAYASGALSLEEGLLVAHHRATIQATQKGQGTMLAAGLSLDEAQEMLSSYEGKISVAAVNGPQSITLAGKKEDLEEIVSILEEKNIFNRFLKVNIAYHSHQMESLQQEVLDKLNFLKPKKNLIHHFSTVSGEEMGQTLLDASYWWQNIREPVQFGKAIRNMIGNGYHLFVEIGPHPVLASFIKENLLHCQVEGESLHTLNRKKEEINSLMECLGGLFAKGYPLSWEKINSDRGSFIKLPTYPWQKKTYWIESEESRQYRLSSDLHPMLSRRISSPQPTWQVEVNEQFFPWLKDHQIEGATVFPGAGYVEAALAIHGTFPCMIEDVVFEKMLLVHPEKESVLQVSSDEQTKTFKVHSQVEGGEWTCHATGRFSTYQPKLPQEKIALESLQQQICSDEKEVYEVFLEQGLEYGPSFRLIKKLWKGKGEALSEILVSPSSDIYHLHPTILDGALQTLIGTVELKSFKGLIIPARLDQISYFSSPHDAAYCHAKCLKVTQDKIIGELSLCDHFGNVCVQIKGIECRLLHNTQTKNDSNLLYQIEWEERPLEKKDLSQQVWLAGFNEESSAKEFSQNIPCTFFSLHQLSTQEDAERLLFPLKDVNRLNILLGYGNDTLHLPRAEDEIDGVIACVHLMKAIDAIRSDKETTLWIVTRGGLSGSSLRGMCRVIRQEYSHVRVRLIDIDPSQSLGIIAEEANDSSDDDEIKWLQGKRYAAKLKKNVPQEILAKHLTSYSLELKTPGLIESLYYKQIENKAPSPHEVLIQVHATSLNFKDLMKVLGMLDQNVLEGTYFGGSFGMECSGTIVAVGSKVKKYAVGDKVCAFVPNTFQSHLTVRSDCIYETPPNASFNEAPIYIPFITALRALKDLAHLKKGEWVLIHSATGAVGLAAIQYARYVGANIIATAGSDEKREYLRNQGIQYCTDSRSLAFVNDVLKWTEGRGVDVVLNSLSGEILTKSWSLLAPYGRFIEIGKRDISMNSPLPMRPFNHNTLFASIDLDRTFVDQPKLIQRLLKEAHSLFAKGIFKPLPCEVFVANQAVDAFQFMARSKHIGKIMLQFEGQAVQGVPLVSEKPIIQANASYVVTGGFSGFGLSAALWLAEQGAKHLILIGRSGVSTDEAKEAMAHLQKEGVSVKAAAMDVSDLPQMGTLFEDCNKNMPPIKGIIHSAMVLNDAFIPQLTTESIQKVLSPKIAGCLHLHHLTQHLPLDFFVLFSSISSLIGNPGQGNYAAANAFLDSFCHYRKKMDLPAVTINWGALNTGVLARNSQVAKHLESHGIKGISKRSALRILEKAIRDHQPQVCALDVNWGTLMQRMPAIRQSTFFSDFIAGSSHDASAGSLIEELRKMDENQRMDAVTELIKETVAKTLKMEPQKLDVTARLNHLGMDSLMAMELQTTMEMTLGFKIPTMELMKGPSIKQLAQIFIRQAI